MKKLVVVVVAVALSGCALRGIVRPGQVKCDEFAPLASFWRTVARPNLVTLKDGLAANPILALAVDAAIGGVEKLIGNAEEKCVKGDADGVPATSKEIADALALLKQNLDQMPVVVSETARVGSDPASDEAQADTLARMEARARRLSK